MKLYTRSSGNRDVYIYSFPKWIPFISIYWLISLARTFRTSFKRNGKSNSVSFLILKSESEICSVISNSLWLHGLYNPRNSPGQNTGVGSLSLLQGSSQLRNRTGVSCIAGGFLTNEALKEALLLGEKYSVFHRCFEMVKYLWKYLDFS